ncbi:MAG: hypothetical protein KJZ54_12990 [Phycisphaerales bacterium]|nr:hypothetical protein [Phycisphaerales bacterium]
MTDNLFEGVACGTIRAREERERRARLAGDERTADAPTRDATGAAADEGAPSLTREQLMLRILDLTGGRSRDFLEGFTDERLADYLERLLSSREPRGPGARWVRRGETPAIVGREAAW